MGKSRASRAVRIVVPEERRPRGANAGRPRKTFLSKVLRTNAIAEDDAQAERDYQRNLAGLDGQASSAIAAMRGEAYPAEDSSFPHPDLGEPMEIDPADDDENDWEDIEDGVEIADEMMQEVLDFAKSYRQYDDKRTWRQRVQRSDEHWKQVMPTLVNAYLRWRYPPPPPPSPPSPPSPPPPPPPPATSEDRPAVWPGSSTSHRPQTAPPALSLSGPSTDVPNPAPATAGSPLPEILEFEIDVYNVFDPSPTVTISSTMAGTHVEALALNGYLSATPVKAAVAISFSTLELLRRIRLFKASYSLESFAKLVCYYYEIPYRRTVRNWISDAFDVYLAILRDVKKGIDRELGRDVPNWRVKNSCPACCYKLEDEPPRKFSRMYCMDGNNSLKRMRPLTGRQAGDERVFADSDYFLSEEFVNGFANEVRVKSQTQRRPMSADAPRAIDDVGDLIPRPSGRDSPAPIDAEGSASLPLNQPCVAVTPAGDVDRARQSGVSGREDITDVALNPVDDTLQRPPGTSTTPTPNIDEALVDAEGDPTDGADRAQSTCTKNWKAAQSDEKKQHTWDIWDRTGIFASACRHGLMLWIIDMVRSGELAKYPLATVAKILEVVGERTLGGYDVGCSFQGTVRRSSLGKHFDELESRICVNAFHGYSHEYSCQVQHHPNGIEGVGLEDLETLERIFSASNSLAAIVRYASPYRRQVLIELFFQQWDDEKYLNLGKMLYDNYRQALAIIKEQGLVVGDAMQSLGLSHDDLRRYAAEEREYLNSLGKESPQDLHEIAYVEALQELRAVKDQLARTNRQFLSSAPPTELAFLPPHNGPTNYEAETSRTRKIETDRRYLDERRKTLTLEVVDLEVRLGISVSWQPSDADYMRVSQYIATRKYQKALSNLQRLVVQRLFELHKMNLARTGYRMRRHIAKNMQTRSRALRNAIQSYNAAAAALDPPRPSLDWDTVSHYQLLQEFDLMNETRADIREKPWAQPAVRETIRLAQRLERAREEIVAVNCEARRVHTSIHDEHALFADVLTRLKCQSSPLLGPVREFVIRRRAASAHVMVALQKLYALPDFSGNPSPGTRVGAAASASAISDDFHHVLQSEAAAVQTDEKYGEGMGVEDDDVQQELTDLTAFMGSLSS